jgi:uncharacterized protein (DUF1810 family)
MEPFNLDRFVKAQQDTYTRALEEIRQGKKRTHWMWFIFPQYKGLGFSETAQYYAINSLDEARAYLSHSVLAPRLVEITNALMTVKNKSVADIFGYPDDLKLHSSLTLFDAASEGENIFDQALNSFFQGKRDLKTLDMLKD